VASGLVRRAAADGARISIADIDANKAKALAEEVGGEVVPPEEVLFLEADIVSPNALGAILDAGSIPKLRTSVVAGGANNQLATRDDGDRLHQRGILYAPDYVINAGGIINVSTEYLGDGDAETVRHRIERIPERLEAIWDESVATGRNPARVAGDMARRLIGRG
jgi:leucine dehydrogenase